MSDPKDDLVTWVKELVTNTETTIIITTVSILEDWVAAAIKTRTRELSSKLEERLFSGYGPLSTFSGKIDIAYAFKLFEIETYNDLRALKDIRNKVAHTSDVLHFKSETLAPLIQKLAGWTRGKDPQTLFGERAMACVEALKIPLRQHEMIRALAEWRPASPETPPSRGK